MISIDPIRPYLLYIKLGLIALLLGTVAFVAYDLGGDNQKVKDVAELAKEKKSHQGTKDELRDADETLRSANSALRVINAEAARRKAEAAKAVADATAAGAVARAARDDLAVKTRSFAKQLEAAKKNPDCEALLAADLTKRCGI